MILGTNTEGSLVPLEMERDCVISQGCSFTLKDRLMDQSDKFDCYVCSICGLFAIANPKTRHFECTACDTNRVYKITMPYSAKMVFQELMAVNIIPRILVDPAKGKCKILSEF